MEELAWPIAEGLDFEFVEVPLAKDSTVKLWRGTHAAAAVIAARYPSDKEAQIYMAHSAPATPAPAYLFQVDVPVKTEPCRTASEGTCPHDTNGDGDCHLCVKTGGCPWPKLESVGGKPILPRETTPSPIRCRHVEPEEAAEMLEKRGLF